MALTIRLFFRKLRPDIDRTMGLERLFSTRKAGSLDPSNP